MEQSNQIKSEIIIRNATDSNIVGIQYGATENQIRHAIKDELSNITSVYQGSSHKFDTFQTDQQIVLKQVINLEPEPIYYFWRSEGKNAKKILETVKIELKRQKDQRVVHLYYYYGLILLQEGDYMCAAAYFKKFSKIVSTKHIIYWICLIHWGKALFYLGKIEKANRLWDFVKKNRNLLPQEMADYYFASIAWREYLSSCLPNFYSSKIVTQKNLECITERAGASQRKNYWFSLAYSEYLQGDLDNCLESTSFLKEQLNLKFKQPVFMVATLLLEARALTDFGCKEERMRAYITLESLTNLRNLNWNSQLFLNGLIGDTYPKLLSRLKEEFKSTQIKKEVDSHRKNIDLTYIYEYLPACWLL